MLHAGYTSTPEIRTPISTLIIISVLTIGIGYLVWKYRHKEISDEEEK